MNAEKQGSSAPHGPGRDPATTEVIKGLGFGFVRHFLVVILGSAGMMAGIGGFLIWHFGMDVSVEGEGIIEPRSRHLVRSEISGIIRKIAVRQGQRVAAGEELVVLDGEEWRTEFHKVEKDLEVNRSRRIEIALQMEQERDILQAEVARTRLEVEAAALYLEKVRAEQELYSSSGLLSEGRLRKPLEELVPVRQDVVALHQRQAELQLAEQRLQAVESRQQEIRTLEKGSEKLRQDKALLHYHLARTTICAPAAGIVLTGNLEKRVGDQIQAGESILELAGMGQWQARIMVRETDLPKVKMRQPARLYVRAFPHLEYKIFSGQVEEVSVEPAPDGKGYSVKVSIADPQVRDRGQVYSLACGMSADVRIVVEQGRIAELLWRRLLRNLGEVSRQEIFVGKARAAL